MLNTDSPPWRTGPYYTRAGTFVKTDVGCQDLTCLQLSRKYAKDGRVTRGGTCMSGAGSPPDRERRDDAKLQFCAVQVKMESIGI